MITSVIILLTAALTFTPAFVGVTLAIAFTPLSTSDVVMFCIMFGVITAFFGGYPFRQRINGRASLVLWYSFEHVGFLGVGIGLSFVSGALFWFGFNVLSGLVGVAGLVLVGKACIEGPCYGWDEFIRPRKSSYPYPTAPIAGKYDYDR